MGKKITPKVTWVGKTDWELKTFHGHELSTTKGTSYNSYLIRDKKNVLIDTVWLPYDKEFVSRLKEEIDINTIDYIIVNHSEVDHSGALPELLREIPGTPVLCTAKGESIMRGHYHENWNFVNVKTGDCLRIGESELTFIEAPMLHWPDTMFTYMSGENILFSNDGFGQHFASESLFNDTADAEEVMWEAEKYYTNILNPFSPMVSRKIKEILALGLPIDMIAPSHGVIWKDNPSQIVEKYALWCESYRENRITIVYDSMWHSTRLMAEAVAEGIHSVDSDVKVKLMHASIEDKNDILTEIFRSKALLLGSPTVNNGFTYAVGGLLEMIKGLKYKNKKAAAFGSYGWSGEAPAQISAHLASSGFEIVSDPLRTPWVPDGESIEICRAYGAAFAEKTKDLI